MGRLMNSTEAARYLGVSKQMLREHVKRGVWKIGQYIPPETVGNKKAGRYIISQDKCDELLREGVAQ